MKQKIYISVILIFSLAQLLYSQIEIPFKEELSIKFNSSEESKIKKALQTVKEGEQMLTDAKILFEKLPNESKKATLKNVPKDLKKTLKALYSAADEIDKGYLILHEVYKEKCMKFWGVMEEQNHYATGLEKAKYYERMSTKYLGRARTIRNAAETINDFMKVYEQSIRANKHQLSAVRSQGRALQIYQDYPVEYDYQWENDIDIIAILAENRPVIIEEPQVNIYEDTTSTIPDTALATVTLTDTIRNVVYITDTVFVLLKDTLNYQDTTLTYRVQIAAHTEPLTEQYLRTIYKGNRKIYMLQEEGWYKYSIGIFKDYQKARQIMDGSDVEQVFIAAYRAGLKINLKDALKKQGIGQDE